MEKTALILEGGGMRGVYTAGVLDWFLDEGIRFPAVYGVSAGACHACSYLSGQRGRAKRSVIDYLDDPRYAGVKSFLRTGDFFGAQMVYDEIPNKLLPYDYEAYLKNPAVFYAAVTNIDTGFAEYPRIRDMRRDLIWIQASSSLPLLSHTVEVGGKRYLDGGISDSIPLAKAMKDGCQKNVVVLTQHRGYQKQPTSMMRLMRLRYHRHQGLVRAMATRHRQYNSALRLAYGCEEKGSAFVIQPRSPVTIDRLEKDAHKLEALYTQGYEDAKRSGGALKDFLANEQDFDEITC